MGNRAVIATSKYSGIGMYLHWNGGRDSVEAFLQYCKIKGYRSPEIDGYGWARLAQVVGNFFGGTLSVGIDSVNNLDCDNGDNGMYIIKNWEIIGRHYCKHAEQRNHDMAEMLQAIDEAQPEAEHLGDYLTADEIPTNELKPGDKVVFIDPIDGRIKHANIIGIGTRERVNGMNCKGLPYMDAYGGKYCPQDENPNNYITTPTARRVKEM